MTDKEKLSIKDLLSPPSKREVPTSLGPMYVRYIAYKDYRIVVDSGAFAKADEREVGLQVLQATTASSPDPGEWSGLSNKLFSELTDSDLQALATVACEVARYEFVDDAVVGLGRGLLDQFDGVNKTSKNYLDHFFQNSISSFSPGTAAALTASVAAIDESVLKWKKLFNDTTTTHTAGVAAEHKLEMPMFSSEPGKVTLPKLDLFNMPEARAARASEKSVEILRQVALHMGEVQSHTASMYSTIVLQAIPEWMAQLESDKAQSEASLRSAATSLKWTKWAVIVSVITSMGIAGWQQYSGAQDAKESLQQANDLRAFWQAQATAQQDLLKAQILETQNLRTELKMLSLRRDQPEAASSGNTVKPNQAKHN